MLSRNDDRRSGVPRTVGSLVRDDSSNLCDVPFHSEGRLNFNTEGFSYFMVEHHVHAPEPSMGVGSEIQVDFLGPGIVVFRR